MATSSKSSLGRNKFIILSLICLVASLGIGSVYLLHRNDVSKLDHLQFVEGQLDDSYSPWIFSYRYWGLKKRRSNRKRTLDLFLVDDLVRYSAGNKLIDNLYEEPFYKLVYDYPKPNVVIGFIDTDDPYVKEVYAINIDNLDLVNTAGIKEDLKNESRVQLVASIVFLLLGGFFIFKFITRSKK